MQNGQCPKCQSKEVYRGVQAPLQAGDGILHLYAVAKRDAGVNLLLDAYVCRNCGYIEMYVADENKQRKLDDLAQDTQRWQKVG